jgi:hypothetical protein
MKHALIAAALALAAPVPPAGGAEPASLELFAWLEGEWLRETKRGQAAERWVRVSEDTFEGEAIVPAGGEMRVFERLRLVRLGDEVFYIAKPDENPYPTAFLLVARDETRFVFENPEHDFPQRIVYTRDGEHGLRVRVEGPRDGETDGFDLAFSRRR